jgi:anti-sigma factor RsiW
MSFLRKKSEHQWVEESLSAYIDGELSPREKSRVEEHLKECRACSESLTTLRQTVALLQELPVLPAPRSFAVRPAVVRPKPVTAPSAWGYGLLRGATALATLLLVLLIGADVGLRFVGVTSLGSWAPAAPAPEVAFAPSLEPTMVPAPAEDEQMFGQTGATEPVRPENAEESAPPAAVPAEAADALQEPQETAVAPPRAEGAEPAGTPIAPPAPAEPPAREGEAVGAGGTETCTAVPEAPAPAPTIAKSAEETVQPEPPPAASPEEEEPRMAIVSPTETPEIMALAEAPEREPEELRDSELPVEPLPLSPLRLAEFFVLGVLVVLASATIFWTWLRRRAG